MQTPRDDTASTVFSFFSHLSLFLLFFGITGVGSRCWEHLFRVRLCLCIYLCLSVSHSFPLTTSLCVSSPLFRPVEQAISIQLHYDLHKQANYIEIAFNGGAETLSLSRLVYSYFSFLSFALSLNRQSSSSSEGIIQQSVCAYHCTVSIPDWSYSVIRKIKCKFAKQTRSNGGGGGDADATVYSLLPNTA